MRLAVASLITISATFAVALEPGAPLELGAATPRADAKLTNLDGKQTSLAELKGEKGTLVVFTCNHCPYAKAWETRLAAIGNEWAKKGFGVVAVNPNDPAAHAEDSVDGMKERAKKLGFQFPYVVDDGSVAAAFGARKTPDVFLFDAKGKLAYKGAIDDNGESAEKVTQRYLADALAAVAAGKEPATKETKSVGCGIKWRK